jgi:hypothetical protein
VPLLQQANLHGFSHQQVATLVHIYVHHLMLFEAMLSTVLGAAAWHNKQMLHLHTKNNRCTCISHMRITTARGRTILTK